MLAALVGDKILVKPIYRDRSEGGILLPEDTLQNRGTVLIVGPKVEHVKVGDTVIHSRMEAYSPGKIELEGELHFLMSEEDILGVLENEK